MTSRQWEPGIIAVMIGNPAVPKFRVHGVSSSSMLTQSVLKEMMSRRFGTFVLADNLLTLLKLRMNK